MPFSDFLIRQKLLNQGVNPVSGAGGPSTPGTPGPGLLGRLSQSLFPTNDPTGLLTPEQQRMAQQRGLLGFGASLLANSGPQPGPGIGFGAALGQALQAGQGAASGGINEQLQALLLKQRIDQSKMEAAGQDPAKVREYQFAQQNGFKGTYEEFLKIGQGGIGNFNPGDYTPESFSKFQQTGNTADLRRYVAPSAPVVRDVNNVPTVINAPRGGGVITQTPLSTLPATADAARTVKAAESEGSATGKATGEALGGITKKGIEATNVIGLLNQADPLIDIATGSGAGAALDAAVGFFGFAPDSAQAAASLKVLESNLLLGLPRLEGPQSDRDAQLYKQAAAQIGDPTVPAPVKKAALQTVRQIQERYRDAFAAQSGASQGPPSLSDAKPANRPPLSSFRR